MSEKYEKREIFVYCFSCDGTGVYVDRRFRPGQAVVCDQCHGEGGKKQIVAVFIQRHQKSGVETVYPRSTGGMMADGRPTVTGDPITYRDFLDDKIPDSWGRKKT